MQFDLKILLKLAIWPGIVVVVNFSLYRIFPIQYLDWHLDTPLHFLGGMSIAFVVCAVMTMLERRGDLVIKQVLVRVVLMAAVVALAAVCWEFYEFVGDYFFGTHLQHSLADTMKDLFMGLSGGIVFALFRKQIKK